MILHSSAAALDCRWRCAHRSPTDRARGNGSIFLQLSQSVNHLLAREVVDGQIIDDGPFAVGDCHRERVHGSLGNAVAAGRRHGHGHEFPRGRTDMPISVSDQSDGEWYTLEK